MLIKVNTLYILISVMNMWTKIQKWGNSHGVRIPISYLNDLDLKENDIIDISVEDNKIVIKKNKNKSFEEIIDGYDGNYICEEFEPYDVRGNELW